MNVWMATEGVSLKPAFRGEKWTPHEVLYWEHFGNRAVRHGKWKLVEDAKVGRWELYDMEKDRTELHDLREELPEQFEALKRLYQEWAEKVRV